jgi:hypothetical protein
MLVAYFPLIKDLNIVYKQLRALKKVLAPTTSGQKHDVHNQYTALKVYNKKQSISK